jgi:hypothetical protein
MKVNKQKILGMILVFIGLTPLLYWCAIAIPNYIAYGIDALDRYIDVCNYDVDSIIVSVVGFLLAFVSAGARIIGGDKNWRKVILGILTATQIILIVLGFRSCIQPRLVMPDYNVWNMFRYSWLWSLVCYALIFSVILFPAMALIFRNKRKKDR